MAKNDSLDKMKYEEAFEELEKIVAKLDQEQNNLDEALGLFERGQALIQRCAELLEQADLKVQQLTANGELKAFDE